MLVASLNCNPKVDSTYLWIALSLRVLLLEVCFTFCSLRFPFPLYNLIMLIASLNCNPKAHLTYLWMTWRTPLLVLKVTMATVYTINQELSIATTFTTKTLVLEISNNYGFEFQPLDCAT